MQRLNKNQILQEKHAKILLHEIMRFYDKLRGLKNSLNIPINII